MTICLAYSYSTIYVVQTGLLTNIFLAIDIRNKEVGLTTQSINLILDVGASWGKSTTTCWIFSFFVVFPNPKQSLLVYYTCRGGNLLSPIHLSHVRVRQFFTQVHLINPAKGNS